MKITTISATNLKGGSFKQPLAPVTVLHGRNFAGKSSRVDALALALCHQVPGVAVRPCDIHPLYSSGTTLSVLVDADDGSYAGAEWALGRKGVSTSFEGALEAPPLVFSAAEFLDLPAKERTLKLFRSLPPPPLELCGLPSITAKIKSIKCDSHTEAHELAVGRYAEVVCQVEAASVPEWLEALVDKAATMCKESKAAAKGMRSTALGTLALATDEVSIEATEAALNKATTDKRKADEALGGARTALKASTDALAKAKALANSWNPDAATADTEALRKELTELEAYVTKESAIAWDDTEWVKTSQQCATAAERLKQAERQLEDAQGNVDSFDSMKCCPTCKASSKGWKNTVMDTLLKAITDAQRSVDSAKSEGEALIAVIATLSQQKACEATRQQKISQARSRVNQLRAELDKAVRATELAAPAAVAAASIPGLQQEVIKAQDDVLEKDTLASLASQAHSATATAHRKAVSAAASRQQVQKASDKAAELEADAEVGQAVRDMLHELLQECVKRSVGPLVDACNRLCEGILPSVLEFRDGEVRLSGRGPTHETMSGTERALVYAALSVYLATQLPFKLLVLDEVGRLDKQNQAALLERLLVLVAAGELDQCVLVGTEPILLTNPCQNTGLLKQYEVVS